MSTWVPRNVLFGVGIVENAYDETALIEIIPAEQLASAGAGAAGDGQGA